MIRALFDTNLWISLLLGHGKSSTIDQVVAVASSDNVELIVPQELIEELRNAIAKSSYLAVRITQAEIDALIERFRTIAVIPPIVPHQGPFTRDPNDDYLIVYALVHKVDYIVTGDRDLLTLSRIEHCQIVTPNHFLEIVH